jgi:hypothetical protein
MDLVCPWAWVCTYIDCSDLFLDSIRFHCFASKNVSISFIWRIVQVRTSVHEDANFLFPPRFSLCRKADNTQPLFLFILGAIQIIRDTFWHIFDPPLPYVSFGDTGTDTPIPLLRRDIFHFSKYKNTSFSRLHTVQLQTGNNCSKKEQKMSRVTLWVSPSLPHVLFGDTVATPRPHPY